MASFLSKIRSSGSILIRFLPFWVFLTFFKFGGGLHYSLISPLGERVLPLWIVGVLMGGTSVLQVILDVPAGRILDRYGYRRFLKVTTFIFLFAALVLVLNFTRETYLISLLLSSLGWLFYGPGINAYILSHAPKESAGRFISLRDVSGSIGIVLSSVALPFILLFNPAVMGWFLFSLLLIALAAITLSPKDHQSVHLEQKLPTQHHYIKKHTAWTVVKAVKRLNPASTMLLLLEATGGAFYGAIWFVVPLVIAHQAHMGLLGIGLGMFDFAIVVLGFLLGNLADKSNKRALVFFGLLLFSLAGMFLSFNFSWLFLLFGFLATTGDEMAGISLWSWLHSLDKNHDHDGMITGVIMLFSDLGWACGPIFAGIFYNLIGPSWTILVASLPIFIVWIFYQYTVRIHPFEHLPFHLIPSKPHRHRHRT
jgi:MFS family permease